MEVYKLTLHKTYYHQGFFNVPVDFDRLVRQDEGPIEIQLAGRSSIVGHVNRSANMNGTARIMGRTELRDWFSASCRELDQVDVIFISPETIKLQPVDTS